MNVTKKKIVERRVFLVDYLAGIGIDISTLVDGAIIITSVDGKDWIVDGVYYDAISTYRKVFVYEDEQGNRYDIDSFEIVKPEGVMYEPENDSY